MAEEQTFNPAWLGEEAKERYTDAELHARWLEARNNPQSRVFNYETGELYMVRGASWVRTSAGLGGGISAQPVPDEVVERAAQRWLMAEAHGPGRGLDPGASPRNLLRGLALAYPHIYLWDPETQQLVDRSNRVRYDIDPETQEMEVVGEIGPREYWELDMADRGTTYGAPPGYEMTPDEVLAATQRLRGIGEEGEEVTSISDFNPLAVLAGEQPVPTGWAVRDFRTQNQSYRALEPDDPEAVGVAGYAVPIMPGTGVMLGQFGEDLGVTETAELVDPEAALQAATIGYSINITQELKPPFLGGFGPDYMATNPQLDQLKNLQAMTERFGKYAEPEAWATIQEMTKAGPLPEEVAPQYLEWDNYYQFAGKGGTYIAQVQQAMVDAGVMTQKEMDSEQGFWGQLSGAAMYEVMFEANANGMTWPEVLRDRKAIFDMYKVQHPEEFEEDAERKLAQFVTPARLEPDYATMSQTVKRLFRTELGRDPHDYEMSLLVNQLDQDYLGQWQAEVAAARSQHDAGNRAIEEERPQAAGTFQSVDPLSRLAETFESKFGPEMDIIKQREEFHSNLSLLMANLAGPESLVGRY